MLVSTACLVWGLCMDPHASQHLQVSCSASSHVWPLRALHDAVISCEVCCPRVHIVKWHCCRWTVEQAHHLARR